MRYKLPAVLIPTLLLCSCTRCEPRYESELIETPSCKGAVFHFTDKWDGEFWPVDPSENWAPSAEAIQVLEEKLGERIAWIVLKGEGGKTRIDLSRFKRQYFGYSQDEERRIFAYLFVSFPYSNSCGEESWRSLPCFAATYSGFVEVDFNADSRKIEDVFVHGNAYEQGHNQSGEVTADAAPPL